MNEGMEGSHRMFDPSEAEHDRLRRRIMNVAFVLLVLANIFVRGNWLSILLLVVAAMPAAMSVRILELRFKMSQEERKQVLQELPAGKWITYSLLVLPVFLLEA